MDLGINLDTPPKLPAEAPEKAVNPGGLFKRLAAMLATRFGMSLLCTFLITCVTKSPAIWAAFKVICALIGLMGDEKVANKVTTLLDSGVESATDAPSDAPRKTIGDRIKEKTKIVAEPVKKAVGGVVDEGKKTAQTPGGTMEERYDYALAAAMVILDQIDEKPDQPKHERLAMAVFAVLHGMERYEQDRPKLKRGVSAN